MFSSHMDMIYKNSALQDIFVKLLFIEYRPSKKIYPLYEKVMSGYISTNSGLAEVINPQSYDVRKPPTQRCSPTPK